MGCVASTEPKPDAGNRLRRDGGYDDDFPDDEGYNGSVTKNQQQQQHRNAPANGTDNGRASHQGLTLVPISAELELTLPLSAQHNLTTSPI